MISQHNWILCHFAVRCDSGYEYNMNTANCDICQRGYYRDQADRSTVTCQMCPIDRITPGQGGTGVAACSQGNMLVTIETSSCVTCVQ